MKDKKGFLQAVLDAFVLRPGVGHSNAAVNGVEDSNAILLTSNEQIAKKFATYYEVRTRSIQQVGELDPASRRPLVLDNSAVEWLLRVALGEIHDLEVTLKRSKCEAERHDELLHEIAAAVGHKSYRVEGDGETFTAYIPPMNEPHHGLLEAIESLKKENADLAADQCSIIVDDDHGNRRCSVTGERTP